MKHDFHFVLSGELKCHIANFSILKKMSMSETVEYIFNFMKPVLEKHFLKNVSCKNSDYSNFGADTDLHVYLKHTDYRYLKQIQSNLYCFSMALVLRFALNEFFEGVDKFGFKNFCKIIKKFGKINFKKSIELSCNKQHMFYSVLNFKQIYHIFDKEYNLIKTKFT